MPASLYLALTMRPPARRRGCERIGGRSCAGDVARVRRLTTAGPREVSSGLALAGFLFLVFVGFTLLAMGPLISHRHLLQPRPAAPGLGAVPARARPDRAAGGVPARSSAVVTFVCLPLPRSPGGRPGWSPRSVFSLNLLVLVLKVLLGRGQPEAADPSFFVGGMAYPSGHTANIVLVYGLVAYLLSRYRGVSRTAVARAVVGGGAAVGDDGGHVADPELALVRRPDRRAARRRGGAPADRGRRHRGAADRAGRRPPGCCARMRRRSAGAAAPRHEPPAGPPGPAARRSRRRPRLSSRRWQPRRDAP